MPISEAKLSIVMAISAGVLTFLALTLLYIWPLTIS